MGRGRVSGRGVAGAGREAGAAAQTSDHPYMAAVRADIARTIDPDFVEFGWVTNPDGSRSYAPLTSAERIEATTKMIANNLSPAVMDLLQADGVKIVLDHPSINSRLIDGADGQWDAQHRELVMSQRAAPSTLRHEAGHALSSSINARQQHFEYDSRGSNLDKDANFEKAVKNDIERIRTKGTDAEKAFLKSAEYYTSEVNLLTGSSNSRSKEMFAETFANLTSPSADNKYAQRWQSTFSETSAAVNQIIKNITETPWTPDPSKRRYGTEKANRF